MAVVQVKKPEKYNGYSRIYLSLFWHVLTKELGLLFSSKNKIKINRNFLHILSPQGSQGYTTSNVILW